MKDQGLVSVHIGPTNRERNISGPVAILMQNDTHFLGAYVGGAGNLVLEILPKAWIGSTVWPRHYPYSEQLIAKVEKLEGASGALAMPTPPPLRETPQEAKVGSHMPGAGRSAVIPTTTTRVYGSERRTAIVSDGQVVEGDSEPVEGRRVYPVAASYPGYSGYYGRGYGHTVLEEVRNLAGVTKGKLEQVKAKEEIGEKKADEEKNS